VRVEAYRIGDSPPAPLFTVGAGPSEVGKATGRVREEMAERHRLRYEFWQQLLNRINQKGVSLHANLSPTTDNWLSTGAGKTGLSYVYRVTRDWAAAEFYIDRGPEKTEENKRIFEALQSRKEQIERDFGGPLIWDQMEGRRAFIIRSRVDIGGLKDAENWSEIQEAMIDAMLRLSRVIQKEVQNLV